VTIDLKSARMPEGMRVYAIGDVHGYADLLMAMHQRIADDLAARPVADWRIIHVGDYVDRGPDSKGVIDFLLARIAIEKRIVALRGNHDQGMLDFLQAPDPFGMFAQNGGGETARSYGVCLDFSDEEALHATARMLATAIPAMHMRFLAERPFSTALGDFFFCHAGIEPGVALDDQSPRMLMWIRDYFLNFEGLHPKVIVHGHTPQPEVDLRPNRINVDTGIYMRQKLSAIVLEGAEKTVMTVHGTKEAGR
jgi:serine/threonine protein phosphatase 1